MGKTKTYDKLKIILGKYHDKDELSALCCGQYTVLGAYDTLRIVPCERWHELRPGLCGETANDEYVLRVIREHSEAYPDIKKFYDEYALVACCLVHISDKSWGDKDNNIADSIFKPSAIFGLADTEYTKIEYCVNLGYPSFVVLIHTNKLSEIENYVKQIRENASVSVAHTIVGYNSEKLNLISDEKLSADIDIAPDGGITLNEQYSNIKNALATVSCENASVRLMYGSYDFCCQFKEIELSKFVAMHEAVFGINNNDFSNTVTRIFSAKPVDINNQKKANHQTWEQLDSRVYNAYVQFQALYEKKLSWKSNEHNAHRRPIDSIARVLSLYYLVISSNHSLDVKTVIGEFLVGFFNAASALMLHMQLKKDNGSVRKVYDSDGNEYTNSTYHVLIEQAINEFRKYTGTLLFDIWRSDSAYFEGQSSEHPSVGSAVKLLFAYNRMLGECDNIWRLCSKASNDADIYDTDFAYLVTSGGMDITVNCDLFNNNHEVLLQYSVNSDGKVIKKAADGNEYKFIRRPIIVVVPEGSLYDVDGTQIRMLHEFFHKRGKRQRKERAMAYYKTMCIIAANILSYVVRSKLMSRYIKFVFDNYVYKNIERRKYKDSKTMVKSEDYKLLLAEFISSVLKDTHGIQNISTEELKYIKSAFEKFDHDVYKICQIAFDDLIKNVFDLLSNISTSDLEKQLCEIEKEKHFIAHSDKADYSSSAYIYDCLYAIFITSAANSSDIANRISDCYKRINELLDKEYKNDESKRFLKNYISARSNDITYCQDIWNDCIDMLVNSNQDENSFLNFIDIQDFNRNFSVLTENFKSLFSESYADYMALKIIWSNKGDEIDVFDLLQYIFVSLFEQRDYKYLFNPNGSLGPFLDNQYPDIEFSGVFLRISVILRLFGKNINSDVFKTKEIEIKERIVQYYNSVMYVTNDNELANKYADELFNILMRIIDFYETKFNNFNYLAHLEKYLQQDCYVANQGIDLFSPLSKSIIKEINGEVNEPYFVIQKWLGLFGEVI